MDSVKPHPATGLLVIAVMLFVAQKGDSARRGAP